MNCFHAKVSGFLLGFLLSEGVTYNLYSGDNDIASRILLSVPHQRDEAQFFQGIWMTPKEFLRIPEELLDKTMYCIKESGLK